MEDSLEAIRSMVGWHSVDVHSPGVHNRKARNMSDIRFGYRRSAARRPMSAAGLLVALVVVLNTVTVATADAGNGAGDKITGSLTIEHVGNHADAIPGSARVELNAFEETSRHPARGALHLEISNAAGDLERRITVRVTDVRVEGTGGAFLGIVTLDQRFGTSTTEPGHDTGHDEPGHDTGHGSDQAGPGDHATGKDRTGQLMAVKVIDRGSPGQIDTLDWKWFVADTMELMDLIVLDSLCDKGPKSILDGNLTVHLAGNKP